MNDDASLQITVPVGVGCVPEVHPAASILTIRWSHEVCIVVSTAVLGIRNNRVILCTSSSEVVLLEVARFLVEAISAEGTSAEIGRLPVVKASTDR